MNVTDSIKQRVDKLGCHGFKHAYNTDMVSSFSHRQQHLWNQRADLCWYFRPIHLISIIRISQTQPSWPTNGHWSILNVKRAFQFETFTETAHHQVLTAAFTTTNKDLTFEIKKEKLHWTYSYRSPEQQSYEANTSFDHVVWCVSGVSITEEHEILSSSQSWQHRGVWRLQQGQIS